MNTNRVIYGQPGEAPMLALTCEDSGQGTGQNAAMRITRFANADEGSGAFFALIGNGHVARIPVDSTAYRETFIWEGSIAVSDPDIEVLTGPRRITATLPGAGMLTLNPSTLPGALIENCRGTSDLSDDMLSDDAPPAQ
ncbi:MAG: hypothetical protein ABJ239_09050 [Erythrobacter sp.]